MNIFALLGLYSLMLIYLWKFNQVKINETDYHSMNECNFFPANFVYFYVFCGKIFLELSSGVRIVRRVNLNRLLLWTGNLLIYASSDCNRSQFIINYYNKFRNILYHFVFTLDYLINPICITQQHTVEQKYSTINAIKYLEILLHCATMWRTYAGL